MKTVSTRINRRSFSVAEAGGQDTIEFRLELLKKAKEIPVGGNNDYDADRSVGMLDLVKSESNWGRGQNGISIGVSAYFCHNSYTAQVVDLRIENGQVSLLSTIFLTKPDLHVESESRHKIIRLNDTGKIEINQLT